MVRGASLLISLQLVSRLLTFAANQLLLRFLTAPLLGLSTQLEVYYLSVLFFARESLRVAIQRQGVDGTPSENSDSAAASATGEKQANIKNDKDQTTDNEERAAAKQSQAVINLGYLAILLGVIVSFALGHLYLSTAPSAVLETPYLVPSVYIYGVAAVVELLSEPCFVLMQSRLQFGTRAAAESAATFVRCAVVFAAVFWSSKSSGSGPDIGVLPFALGQLSYGVVLLLVYLISTSRLASVSNFSLFPRAIPPATAADDSFLWSYFYRPTVRLAASMSAQGLVKHLLTQGDTFLVSLLSTPEVQGVYALVANYGGLLARLLFQPVEESCRSYFSRLLSAPSSRIPVSQDQKNKAAKTPSTAIQEARQSLYTLLRLYTLLSTIILALGPSAAPSLLALVAGRRWTGSGAGGVLSAYCFYIPFMALNGLTESFVASVASEADVHRQSVWMGAFSAVFAAAAFVFMRVVPLGATGLVVANAVNMLCRIVWSVVFVKAFFRRYGAEFEVGKVVPGAAVATSLAAGLAMHQLQTSSEADGRPFWTLVKVGGSAVPFLLLMYV